MRDRDSYIQYFAIGLIILSSPLKLLSSNQTNIVCHCHTAKACYHRSVSGTYNENIVEKEGEKQWYLIAAAATEIPGVKTNAGMTRTDAAAVGTGVDADAGKAEDPAAV